MNLDNFVENDIKRKIELIDCLRKSTIYRNVVELSDELGITRKTLAKDLDELLLLSHEKNCENLFDNQSRVGYRIDPNLKKEILLIKQTIYLSSFNLFFLTKLLSKDVNLVELMSLTHLSEATIRKKLGALRILLQEFNLTIRYKKGYFSILGNESAIRFFYFTLYWKLYRGVSWNFQEVSEMKLLRLVNSYIEEFDVPITGNGRMQILYFLAIGMIRYHRNKKIPVNFFGDEYQRGLDALNTSTGLNEKWFASINTSTIEANYFLLFISTRATFSRKYYTFFQENEEIFKHTRAWIATEKFIDYFDKTILGLSLEQKIILRKNLYPIHIYADFFDRKQDLATNEYSIDNEYFLTKTIQLFDTACTSLFRETNYSLFKNKEYLIQQYIFTLAMFKDIHYFEPPISILIDADVPYNSTKRIVEYLSKLLSLEFNILIYDQYDEALQQHYDILFTTNALDHASINRTVKYSRTVYIDIDFRISDYTRIKEVLIDVYNEKIRAALL